MFLVAGWYIIISVVIGLLTYAVAGFSNKNRRKVVALSVFLMTILLTCFAIRIVPWHDVFRPLPLLMLFLTVYFFTTIVHYRKNGVFVNRTLPLFVLSVFAFLLLLKIMLNVHIFHYGFALAMPATLLFIVAILHELPAVLDRSSRGAVFARSLGLVLVIAVLFAYMSWNGRIYSAKTYPVGSGRDMILAWPPHISEMEYCTDAALKKINDIMKPEESFVALPDAIMLNYLSRRKNPCPYFELAPPMVEAEGDGKIIGSLSAAKPDYIVLTNRNTSEHGFPCFGSGYAVKIMRWIDENYAPQVVVGNPQGWFRIIISKRKNVSG
jgi:hypothetical protein